MKVTVAFSPIKIKIFHHRGHGGTRSSSNDIHDAYSFILE